MLPAAAVVVRPEALLAVVDEVNCTPSLCLRRAHFDLLSALVAQAAGRVSCGAHRFPQNWQDRSVSDFTFHQAALAVTVAVLAAGAAAVVVAAAAP